MKDLTLKVNDSINFSHSISIKTLPDICPCCHKGIQPIYHFGFFRDNEYSSSQTNFVQAIFRCPRRECQQLFIADYSKHIELRHHIRDERFELRGLSPVWFKKKEFSESIQKLSSSFCEIFNEAAAAESSKLKNITGPGYRKALEFLIKDYLISIDPPNESAIKATNLQRLIQTKIHDINLKSCAERAAWLGNDETHYLRKWEPHDIDDLKRLITLTVNWVEICILTTEYQTQMPKPSKP